MDDRYACINCRKEIDYDEYGREWFHIDSEKTACNEDDSPNTVAEPS